MTIHQWLKGATAQLMAAGIETARLDCLVLLEDALGRDRAHLLAEPDLVMDAPIVEQLEGQLERRIKHEPLAYIRGRTEFFGREFSINQHVLVPRPESEAMVELLKTVMGDAEQIIDVGTGSGALAITAKLELPLSQVTAIDIDPDCLEVAAANASKHRVDITFFRGDLLEPLLADKLKSWVILANLPYVPDGYAINDAAKHEPELAIFAGKDGLDLYRRLFEQVAQNQPKSIITESLPKQHAELVIIARGAGYKLTDEQDFVQVFTVS